MTSPSRPSWRVVFARTDTDATIATFDCAISKLSRYVSPKVGELAIQIPIPNAEVGREAAKVFGGSGFMSMYVYRNNDVWWGGFLDEVGVSSAGDYPALVAMGATFEAYPDRREVREDMTLSGEQTAMVKTLWDYMQKSPGGDLRVSVATPPPSGIGRTLEVKRHEVRTVGSVLKEVSNRSDGYEWIIECYSDSSGMRRRDLITGHPVIGRPANGTILTFPGNVITYQMLDSALDGALSFQARGKAPDPVGSPSKGVYDKATGTTTVTGGGASEKQPPIMSKIVTDDELVRAGYTLTDTTIDRPQEKDVAVLDRWAEVAKELRSGPLLLPEVTCRIDDFTQSILGGVVDLRINDYLWPLGAKGEPGYRVSARVIGYEVDPGEFGADDIVKLMFENPQDKDNLSRSPD